MISNVRLRVPVSKEDHTLGPEDAPLVLLEYGDYECSFCRKAHPISKGLVQNLQKDLRFVFRNFPLTSIHPHAMDAARAAEAAGLQGKFWEMHDVIYENQENLELEDLLEHAAALSLDLERFSQDMQSPWVEEKVSTDLYGGARSGVNGTPTFFINGFRYDGDWSYQSLLTVLTGVRQQILGKKVKKAA